MPSTLKSYTFTVTYAGDDTYASTTAACIVSVTSGASSDGTGSSGGTSGAATTQVGLYAYLPEPKTREDFMAPEDQDLQEDTTDYSVSVYRTTGSSLGVSWTPGQLSEDGEEKGLTFVTNGRASVFSEVWVDGKTILRDHYTIHKENGQIDVVLKPEYLSMLENGRHTLRIIFTNGSAETSFTVMQ